MIASSFDGRLRFRHKALKYEEALTQLQKALKNKKGIEELVANPRTGSVTVYYDPAKITGEKIAQAGAFLDEYLAQHEPPAPAKKIVTARRLELAALGGAYVVTAASAYYFNRRVHIAAGVLSLLLASKHTFCRRRCI